MTGMKGVSLAAVLVALGLTGACTDLGESTKAGGEGPPVTLRVGTNDDGGRASLKQIEEFGRGVDKLSKGRIRIEPVPNAAGRDADNWDQSVARKVSDGDLDAGLVPSRAFASLGATSLQAINAPFLITDEPTLDRVVTGDLADELMSGLGKARLVGLGLVPESLRHPFSFDGAVLGPGDYQGKTFRAPESVTTTALFEALGARSDDPSGSAFNVGVADGEIAGAESSYELAAGFAATSVATGDVTFFPKVNVFVVSQEEAEDLGEKRLAILRRAATETRDWAIIERLGDAEQAQAFCDAGGTVVQAGPNEVAALKRSVKPVYKMLERDALTAELIAEIRELSRAETPEFLCTPSKREQMPNGSDVKAEIPDGVYRYDVTERRLLSGGASEAEARENAGVTTATMDDGVYTERWRNPVVGDKVCTGEYVVVGARMFMHWTPGGGCSGAWAATATIEGDTIAWSDIEPLPPETSEAKAFWEAVLGAPWTRIGAAGS